jgi:hypothetical protein
LPQIPGGDVAAAALDFAIRNAIAAAIRFRQLDAALRQWPVAVFSRLLLALLFAAPIAAGP